MAKDYGPIAKAIAEHLGGVDNIENITHCMTRLRINLRDPSLADDAKLKKIGGVLGIAKASGQIQIIIGNNVAVAYKEMLKLGNFGEASDIAKGKKKEKLTLKLVFSKILDALVGTMSPIIPPIIGGSLLKLVAMLLTMGKFIETTSDTFHIINATGDAVFFFLPIMVAVSASKKFNCNTYLAAAISAVLVVPEITGLLSDVVAVDQGLRFKYFFFIPVLSVKYTYTVIPALMITWILSYVERWVDSWTPAVLKNFLKPLIIMFITAPIALVIVGPIGYFIGYGISAFVFFIHDVLGWLAVAIMGALWPLLVLTGMHRVFTPTIIQTIGTEGSEGTIMPCELGANLAQGGAALAVAAKTKNKELRQTALAAAASALVAGITEPAMYGVNVRLKRPFIAVIITGFVCGAIAGMTGLSSSAMSSPSIFTSVQFFNSENFMWSVAWTVVIIVVSIVLSFILTLALGFKDLPEEEDVDETADGKAKPVLHTVTIASPVKGAVVPITEVNDETFASGVLGTGVAILPAEGKVFAPFDGEIMQFETGHAVGLISPDGFELLIHIGINTVELNGQGFKTYFASGAQVKKGDLLIEFDGAAIKQKGYDIITPVIVNELGDYSRVTINASGNVEAGDALLTVHP
ncbi:MAG: beta-glucoside-specific PTS transporter subunit IIABC [Treponema sp.]|jgi:PTS system arbutin/cellobiose/salicin-specific IIC component|nr:beta-glucoside-specific PTS transporter subunit IIABC [Treponema sp.]